MCLSEPRVKSAESLLEIVASSEREAYAFFMEAGNSQLLYVDSTLETAVPATESQLWRMLDSDRSLHLHQLPDISVSVNALRQGLALRQWKVWIDEALVDISRGATLFAPKTRTTLVDSIEKMLSAEAEQNSYDPNRILQRVITERGAQALS